MSHASTMLEKIEAVLEGRIDSDVESYQIAGRNITKIPITELIVLRDRYKRETVSEVAAEDLELGLGNKRKILTRF
jgi:hypothetical protein